MSQPASVQATFDREDHQLLLRTVAEFTRDVLEPEFRHPEKAMPDDTFSALFQKLAGELGLLPEAEPTGLELWADLDTADGMQLSLSILQTIAECNAALAMALHVTALGAVAARQLGRRAESVVLLPPGSAGFAGTALARLLASRPLSESERQRLRAAFPWAGPCERPLLFHAPVGWESVVFAGMRDDDRLHWRILPRKSVEAQRIPNAHGLDELPLWRIDHLPEASNEDAAPTTESETLFFQMIGAAALGNVAIALGTTRRAAAIVFEYAAGRTQGGRAIREHAAVQLLLGRVTAAIESVAAMLAAAAPAKRIHELQASLACKAIAHPLLCDAANAAMQVMGGYGYMQDMGVEKVVRDNNHLRLLGGTPRDIHLFLAEIGGTA